MKDVSISLALALGQVKSAGESSTHGKLYRSTEAADFEQQLAEKSGCAVKPSVHGSKPPSNVGPNMAILPDGGYSAN